MKKLSIMQIQQLHSLTINEIGGIDGIRDIGLLESAVMGVYQTFDDVELYPTIEEKCARMCFNLIKNHPFVDGNKRTGMLAMFVMLEINNIKLECKDDEIINIGNGIASGKISYEEIIDFIQQKGCKIEENEMIK